MNNLTRWEPVDIGVEQQLLGAIFINNDAYGRVADLVKAEDFYEGAHQNIFRVMASQIEAGKAATPMTVRAFLEDYELVPGMSLQQYLAQVAANATTIVNAPDFARVIRELADRRRVAEIAHQMAPRADTEAAKMASDAIEALDTILTSSASTSLPAVGMAQVMAQSIDQIAKAYQDDSKLIGVPTGLKDLDQKTGGLAPGDLIVLAGRPGMGKSAVLLSLLRNAGRKGYRSLLFSLEMSAAQCGERMISDTIFDLIGENVPYANLRTGSFHEKLFQQIRDAAEINRELPITIEEQPSLTLSQIATRARRMKRRGGLDILAVDHLDLVRPAGRYAGNKVYELGEITSGLKALAKELAIPVILLSQLSRDVEKREDKRPMLSDLRSSGSIEQDADSVIFFYRPMYYLQNSEPKAGTPEYVQWQDDLINATNKLFAIIAKQRMGPTGTIELFCDIANNAVRDMGVAR
jgi:replicative DNA helicase